MACTCKVGMCPEESCRSQCKGCGCACDGQSVEEKIARKRGRQPTPRTPNVSRNESASHVVRIKNFLISVFRANPNITPNPAWTMFQLQFPPTTNETISKGYPTKKKVSTLISSMKNYLKTNQRLPEKIPTVL